MWAGIVLCLVGLLLGLLLVLPVGGADVPIVISLLIEKKRRKPHQMSRPLFGFRKALRDALPNSSNCNVPGERSVLLAMSR